MDPRRVEAVDQLDQQQREEVTRLIAAAEAVDGVAALNEQALLTLGADDASYVRHLLGTDRGAADADDAAGLRGYVHLDRSNGRAGAAAECVVHPAHRRAGWGELLVRRALEEAAADPVLLWSHGDHPAAAALAGRLGFARVRDLLQLRRELDDPLPPAALPVGVTLRGFEVGRDERAWLDLNARVFADHPEQGGLDADDLSRRLGSDWFDAAGFLLAERDDRMLGFHWTKVHHGDARHHPVGEVYVVGVDPTAQGGGLGRALTLAGLHHLRDRGLGEVLLYVEADNTAARTVYERLGFRLRSTDIRYRHPGLSG